MGNKKSPSSKVPTGEKRTNVPSNSGRKGKRPFNKRKGRGDSDSPNSSTSTIINGRDSSLNDISWYAKNPELLAAAARIPTPYRPGMNVPAPGITNGNNWPAQYNSVYIPGVFALQFNYSVGRSEDITSAASICAKEMYGRIRKSFSSSLQVDPPDLFMYCLALDQIHAYIAWLKRVYRCATAYSPDNRLMPNALLRAMGFADVEVNNILTNRTDLWGDINTLVHMVNKFSVPADMSIYTRHRWMNENVYEDRDAMASQMYIFNPNYFYVVDETGTNGTKLVPSPIPTTYAQLYNYGLTMVQLLSDWDDAYTINGYIERAYEGSGFYKADLLEYSSVQQFDYVPEVLTQIHNAETCDRCRAYAVTNFVNWEIDQDPNTNAIIHVPAVKYNSAANDGLFTNHLLNLPMLQPTAADVTIATRLKCNAVKDGTTKWDIHGGTEVPTHFRVVTKGYSGISVNEFNSVRRMTYYSDPNASYDYNDVKWVLDYAAAKESFAYAPMLTVTMGSTNLGATILVPVETLTELSNTALDNINRVCTYSEFNCFRNDF